MGHIMGAHSNTASLAEDPTRDLLGSGITPQRALVDFAFGQCITTEVLMRSAIKFWESVFVTYLRTTDFFF